MKSLLVPLLFLTLSVHSQSIFGKWKTIDDESGVEKSIVEIFEKEGKVYGKIVRIFPAPGDDPDPVCEECDEDDARYKKKIIGMEIITGLKHSNDQYSDGEILDPENGKVYRCKLWLEGTSLKVRGYWGPFYRTQTWKKAN
jgi:uncharacterized protein (DUF2147 family)